MSAANRVPKRMARLFQAITHVDRRIGVTGKLVGTTLTDPTSGLPDGSIWVLLEGDRASTAVDNYLVRADVPGIHVETRYNRMERAREVTGLVHRRNVVTFGAAASGSLAAQPIGELWNVSVRGRNLLPGRLRVWDTGTLKVNVSDFWYLDSAGALKKWTPTALNTLDLASNVPAASGGINTHRAVLVTFNPDATSPALVATTGTAKLVTLPLQDADIEAIAFPDGHLSLAAVELTTGDTTLVESDITDTRFHVGGGATGTGGTTGEYMLDDDGALMLDDDGYIMRDDG